MLRARRIRPSPNCCRAASATAQSEMAAVPEGANLGLGCGNPAGHRRAETGRNRAGPGQRRRLRLPSSRRARWATSGAGHRRGHDPGHGVQGPRQRGQGRLRQRGIPPRRDRASAGGRRHGGRDHFQLRHQPLAGQGPGVPRCLPGAETRRPPGDFRHRHHRRRCRRPCSRKSRSTPACMAGAAQRR